MSVPGVHVGLGRHILPLTGKLQQFVSLALVTSCLRQRAKPLGPLAPFARLVRVLKDPLYRR